MTNLQMVHAKIAGHCGRIAGYFKSETGPRVTIIVRNRRDGIYEPSASLLVGDDDIDDVIAALQYLKQREPVSIAGDGSVSA